jgi:hypothetical protein
VRFFLLVATHGIHPFYDEEPRVRDCRRVPIKCFGYAVSFKRGRVHVRIEREEYKAIRAAFLSLAKHRSAQVLADAFIRLPYEPYAPVRRQLLLLWRLVNRVRREASFEPVQVTCIRMRRKLHPSLTAGPMPPSSNGGDS